MPALPMPIRILRDAVIVISAIALGDWIAVYSYRPEPADPIMVQTFQAVFGTMAFAITGYLAQMRRARHLAMTALLIWLIAGAWVLIGVMHPLWWLTTLVMLSLMATIGGGIGWLVDRLARD